VRLCPSRAALSNLCRGDLLRKSVSGTYGCGRVLRSLQEAAAMLFPARQTGSSELPRSRLTGLADPRTTRMACGHHVVVSRHVLHFTCGMHMASMHEEHRRQGHLGPSHHGHQQCRRDGLLHHPALVWQGKSGRDVTAITPGFDSERTTALSHQILQRRPQLAETERIPAAPEFARLHPLAGQQQFLPSHFAESQAHRKLRHRKKCRPT